MSVTIGDRATYMGETGIIVLAAPFLDEPRWLFRYRNGKARTGWSALIAAESALSDVTTPTWDVGDSVRVGFTPNRRKGTVTAITQEGGRAIYEVTFPAEDQKTEDGTKWIQEANTSLVGAEFLGTNQ